MSRRLAPLALTIALAGCGGSSGPAPSPSPGGGTTIRGTERIGWDQPAPAANELSGLRYALYVDGARSEIADVSCGNSASAAGFACSGRLPPMSPGAHTLELASFIVSSTGILESPRSAPLQVTVSPSSSASATADPLRLGSPPSESGTPARGSAAPEAATVAEGFDDIVDLAPAGRTRLVVAERSGALHLIDRVRGVRESALALEGTRAAGGAGTLASVAEDPNFEASGLVYVLQTAVDRDGPVWQVSRYRVVGGRFGERAVIVRLRGASDPAAPGTLRVGDDGRLYIAVSGRYLDDRPGEGYVLRVNPDGSVPREDGDPDAPLWATTAHPPAGLAWHEGEVVWTADARADGSARLVGLRSARAGDDGAMAPLGEIGSVHRVASTRGRRSSLPDGILVAADSGLYLARPQTDTAHTVMERLFEGPVRAAVVTGAGAVVVATPDRVLALGRN